MTTYYPNKPSLKQPLASSKNDPSVPKLNSIIENSKVGRYYNTDVYYSLNNIKVFHGGRDYSDSTTVVFPDPEHDEGVAASGTVFLGLTSASLSVSGGTKHQPGDSYIIVPADYLDDEDDPRMPAVIQILSVNEDDDYSVDKWTLVSPGYGFVNGEPTIIPQFTSPRTNAFPATITFNSDQFTIVDIQFTSYGTGYLKSPYPRYLSFDNVGSGTGAMATVGTDSDLVFYKTQTIEDTNTEVEDLPVRVDPIYQFDRDQSKGSINDYYALFTSPIITHNDYE